jgi:hypothetical protein
VKAHQAEFPIKAMCRLLGVSTSGYYAWASRTPSARDMEDQQLAEHIRAIHKRSRGTYGVPRIHAELQELGVRIARKRVASQIDAFGWDPRGFPPTQTGEVVPSIRTWPLFAALKYIGIKKFRVLFT